MPGRRFATGSGRVCAASAALLLLLNLQPSVWGQARMAAERPSPGDGQSATIQQEQILDELRAIRHLLERLLAQGSAVPPVGGAIPAPEADVTFASLPTEHVLGRNDAPLTLVEFTDLQCPFCRQFHLGVLEDLKRAYIDTGKLRYISRDLPLPQLHPLAVAAARASRCAGVQRRFWEMRHAILVNNERLSPGLFDTFASDIGLDAVAFRACMDRPGIIDAAIQTDIEAAQTAGITGTPVFVLGRTRGTGVEGRRIDGAQPFAVFDSQIKAMLELSK